MLTSARARAMRRIMIRPHRPPFSCHPATRLGRGTGTLRVGETQDVTAINPYLATLFSDYEVFALNYYLLVGYRPADSRHLASPRPGPRTAPPGPSRSTPT